MNTYADKITGNSGKVTSAALAAKAVSVQQRGAYLQDNRPRSVLQMKLKSPTGTQVALANSDTIQLYTELENEELGTDIQSENREYFLTAGATELYATDEADVPQYCEESRRVNGEEGEYIEYIPSSQFKADCLASAEEVMHEQEINDEGVFSREYHHENEFGDTEEGNWEAAEATQDDERDRHAVADVGEAFAIVEEEPINLGGGVMCQYHAAAVVASDGSDRITLEVFGAPGLDDRDVDGTFRIYDTDPESGNTFHDGWSETFPNGITIVLEPSGDPE